MTPDPKPKARIRDRDALRHARLTFIECVACGRRAGSIHHVIPRGEGGDDVLGNLVGLCGSGTTGCHGAWHGSPYIYEYPRVGINTGEARRFERRDREWVARRVGRHIAEQRPDVAAYVLGELGEAAGWDYFERIYLLTPA